MTFRYQPLDRRIADGAVGGPTFATVIGQSDGTESREQTREFDLGVWDVAFNARREDQWRPLREHFLCMHGRADSWPFRDPLDCTCDQEESFLVAIDATHWQMYKRYVVGALTYDKKIVLPFDTVVYGPAMYTVGAQTGIITKTSGSGAPTSFATSFYKLVRYDTDEMLVHQITHKPNGTLIVEWQSVPIREIPE